MKVNLSGLGWIAREKIAKPGSGSANLQDGLCGQRMDERETNRGEVRSSEGWHTLTDSRHNCRLDICKNNPHIYIKSRETEMEIKERGGERVCNECIMLWLVVEDQASLAPVQITPERHESLWQSSARGRMKQVGSALCVRVDVLNALWMYLAPACVRSLKSRVREKGQVPVSEKCVCGTQGRAWVL